MGSGGKVVEGYDGAFVVGEITISIVSRKVEILHRRSGRLTSRMSDNYSERKSA